LKKKFNEPINAEGMLKNMEIKMSLKERIFASAKSVLILALAALAVFQVGRLWLFDITNRNFFLYLQARFPPSAPDGQQAFARPFRIITGAGDGVFEIMYSGIGESQEWEFGERALAAVLRGGSPVIRPNFAQAAVPDMLARPVFLYEYTFDMCAETFARALGQRNASLLTNEGLHEFRSVAIQPPSEDDASLQVFFIGRNNRVWQFALLPGTRRFPAEDFEIEILPVSQNGKHFTAGDGGFIPQIPPEGFAYYTVVAENPFRNPQGLFTLTDIRPLIEPFFNNPATIIPSMSGVDNIITFSNLNTMVRYHEAYVLEYSSYRTIGREASANLMADFSVALAFVDADPHVINEFFLHSYELRGREFVFRFNYVINNLPLVFTGPWYSATHCRDPLLAPIEVVVDHGRVVRYRRIVHNFHLGTPAWADAIEGDYPFTLGFPISKDSQISLTAMVGGG